MTTGSLTPRRQLLIATTNYGKFREVESLLGDLPYHILNLSSFDNIVEVQETGLSFAENAELKARGYAQQTGCLTLADDSGLEVTALNGRPGVFSARYGVSGSDDAGRTQYLLEELGDVAEPMRQARFVCALALYDPYTQSFDAIEGESRGRIALTARGTNGFGYDPIFIPEGYSQTFGELSTTIKNKLSHRARALVSLRAQLNRQLRQQTI